MEKKLLYIGLIILAVFSIYQNLRFYSHRQIDHSLLTMKECIYLEDACKGKIIENIKISDAAGKEDFFDNILSMYPVEYYLVIISSIEACSTCREEALKMWSDLYLKNRNLAVVLIIAEQEEINKRMRRQITASIKGMHIEIPFYFDHDGILLDYLNVTPQQTPLSIILTHNKQIIALDKAGASTKERTSAFKEFFLNLNSPGGK